MNRGTIALAAGAYAIATVSVALAETTTLARSGAWEVFGGTTTKTNRALCGMSSETDGRYFGMKLFSGDQTFTIQLGRSAWKIENGNKQKVQLRFDGNSPWNADGTGMHFDDGDAGLEFTVERAELATFMKEFRQSAALYVSFTGSNAKPWTIGLDGTNALADTFQQCNSKLK
jgi:hypothetical protein